MSPEAADEVLAIAGELDRMPLADRRRPERPHEIRAELVQRLRALARSAGRPAASRRISSTRVCQPRPLAR